MTSGNEIKSLPPQNHLRVQLHFSNNQKTALTDGRIWSYMIEIIDAYEDFKVKTPVTKPEVTGHLATNSKLRKI